jgi:hypothetical protein
VCVFLLVVYNVVCCVWLLVFFGKRVFVAVAVAGPLAVSVAVVRFMAVI